MQSQLMDLHSWALKIADNTESTYTSSRVKSTTNVVHIFTLAVF